MLLKEILNERGITAYKLAKETGLNIGSLYNAINGKTYFYPKMKSVIASYLGLSEEEIFGEEK